MEKLAFSLVTATRKLIPYFQAHVINVLIDHPLKKVRNQKSLLLARPPTQANGKVEVANRSLLKIIKTRLEGAKGIWPDELPSVLWTYRTTVRTPTGEIPFKLAYRSDAVIPAKVGLTSHRVAHYKEEENAKHLRLNLDLIDEVRMDVEQRVVCYKNLMTKYHDALVKPRQFNIGDLILKRVSLAIKDLAHGKF
ncbi:uncharacterized protein LOC126704809 [Quercus robur]|uniref:uncharacterized protein LOC126704809 n=1 Tax=Quercus robur TaxID=38942 RepID=UPI002161C1CE|nr:uncharacterized protein LOC126704809 [Quercus robur]